MTVRYLLQLLFPTPPADNWNLYRPFYGRPYMRRRTKDGWERRPITRSDPEWDVYAEWLKWMAAR